MDSKQHEKHEPLAPPYAVVIDEIVKPNDLSQENYKLKQDIEKLKQDIEKFKKDIEYYKQLNIENELLKKEVKDYKQLEMNYRDYFSLLIIIIFLFIRSKFGTELSLIVVKYLYEKYIEI